MSARDEFRKALILLDHGKLGCGEDVLKKAIEMAKQESDPVSLVQALVCLGDLFCETGCPAKARPLLAEALDEQQSCEAQYDDLLAEEFGRARQLCGEQGWAVSR
ncbi:Uncharacterised protein [Bordetella ansorpii]|uniref:Uncharacterized protein n=1 Tax=Bordetella ansorpii TaxID=288768 RepID=A0A157NXP0_9BORD|nr:hypothetical protein [Bordetella ansorpii]SAI25774.1 Uncharacterised protein [Bordetella ansorpii]